MKRSETSIKTERLWLRQIDETDAESIVALRSGEDVYKYFINPKKLTVDEHRVWYNNVYIKSDDRIDWIAVDDETGEFIGVYGAKKIDYRIVEVSYITAGGKKHKGYASEAVNAVIDWCKLKWKAMEFIVNIQENNEGSLRFALSLGFASYDYKNNFVKLKLKK